MNREVKGHTVHLDGRVQDARCLFLSALSCFALFLSAPSCFALVLTKLAPHLEN